MTKERHHPATIDDRLNQIIRELVGCGIPLGQAVQAFEGKYIDAAMAASRGNITRASRALGVHRNTLHNKLRSQSILTETRVRSSRRVSVGVSAKSVSAAHVVSRKPRSR